MCPRGMEQISRDIVEKGFANIHSHSFQFQNDFWPNVRMLLVHMVPETDATSSETHRTNAFRKTRPSRPFAKPFRMQKGILQANGYLETRNRNKMKYKTNPPFPASFPLKKSTTRPLANIQAMRIGLVFKGGICLPEMAWIFWLCFQACSVISGQ